MLVARRNLAGRLSGKGRTARCPDPRRARRVMPSRPPVVWAVNEDSELWVAGIHQIESAGSAESARGILRGGRLAGQEPREGGGGGVANPLRARPASPPLKRRAGAWVSLSAPKQKPRQGAGLSLRVQQMGPAAAVPEAESISGKPTNSTRQTIILNAADASSVARGEGGARTKKPPEAGHRRGLPSCDARQTHRDNSTVACTSRGKLVVVDKIATMISLQVSSKSGSQPDAAMIASGWLRKVSNTCSSHARINRFNAVDNGSLRHITQAGTLVPPGAYPWVTRACLLREFASVAEGAAFACADVEMPRLDS